MKKGKGILGILVLLSVFVLVGVGCTTHHASITGGADTQAAFARVNVPAKDFTSVGLVFAQTEVEIRRNRDSRTLSGDVITYNMLMQEAARLGAHAIVNVTIDRVIEERGEIRRIGFIVLQDTGITRETWKGNALAIRYTDKLVEVRAQGEHIREGAIVGGLGAARGDGGGFFGGGGFFSRLFGRLKINLMRGCLV